MKKRLQGIIVGVLIGILFTSGIAIAANTTTLYNVVANGVKIVVDGQKLNPTDANGNKVEPIIYNGTTYLPVRAVANALGKAVYWDGPNYTVYLGDMDGELTRPTIELENMINLDGKMDKTTSLKDNYENNYTRAIRIDPRKSKLNFLLNMKYSKFKGKLYIANGATSSEECYFIVEADGNTIYTSPLLTKSSRPIDLNINVTGCNDVKMYFNLKGDSLNDLPVCLGDAGFYQ